MFGARENNTNDGRFPSFNIKKSFPDMHQKPVPWKKLLRHTPKQADMKLTKIKLIEPKTLRLWLS